MNLHAQSKHEFSISGFGGLSGLNYDVMEGSQKSGFGGGGGLGYHYFFNEQWSVGTGVELAFFNAAYNSDGADLRYMTKDKNDGVFEFRSKVGSYEEKQSAMLLQIPLMLQYQTGDRHQFYAALGGKAGIPIAAKYKISAVALQNAGQYDYEIYEYTTQQFMGFGTFNLPASDDKLNFKTAFFLSAEIGGKFKLSDKHNLYVGVYLDYGLNNILETQDLASLPPLVEYNSQNPSKYAVNSILKSKSTEAFTEKLSPMAVGIKLRLAFGKGSVERE